MEASDPRAGAAGRPQGGSPAPDPGPPGAARGEGPPEPTWACARKRAALLDQTRDAILVRDLAGRVTFWSRGAERLYGWSPAEAVGRTAAELLRPVPSPELDEAERHVLEDLHWAGDLRHATRAGRPVDVTSRWSPVRDDAGRTEATLMISTDVTGPKALKAQAGRAERLETLSALAGGIAHDMNNVLTPLTMGLDFLAMPLPPERRAAALATLRAGVTRGAGMVRQVLSLARGAEGQWPPLQLAQIVHSVEAALRESLPKSIAVRADVPPGLWPIAGGEAQLHQALMNVCLNARDAMPAGGALTIGAENAQVDQATTGLVLGITPGRYVRAWVADTGAGIPADVLEKMFDPYFTTKPRGQGTGLGLATVLGIVRSHGGSLNVETAAGRGTTVSVYLPVPGA